MKEIQRHKLENGMSVMLRKNQATPTVSFAFRIAAGSLDDPADSIGLMDFSAPLFTKGTEKKSPGEIAEKIDSLGLELSFSSGRHSCMLYGRVLSDYLEPAMKLCRELLEHSQPPEDEVTRMKQRMHTGLNMQLDDPASVATDRMREMIYGSDHPYGRTIRQQLEGLQQITRDDVIGYFRTVIKPGAIQAVIVGDFDDDSIGRQLDKAFSSWNTGGEFNITRFAEVKDAEASRTEMIPMPGKTQSDIALGWQGISRTDEDYYALLAGNTALGRMGLGGRIGQRVREDEGMAYYAYANFSAGVGAGPYAVRAGVNPKDVNKTIEIAVEEIRKCKQHGLKAEEIEDSVKYLSGSMARQMETNSGLASVLLNQELFKLGDDYYRRFPEILAALDVNRVNDAMAKHLKPDCFCCAVAGPEK
jgi:zinc protease